MTFDDKVAEAAVAYGMTKRPAQVFVLLAEARGRVLTHEYILAELGAEDKGHTWVADQIKRMRGSLPVGVAIVSRPTIGYQLFAAPGWRPAWEIRPASPDEIRRAAIQEVMETIRELVPERGPDLVAFADWRERYGAEKADKLGMLAVVETWWAYNEGEQSAIRKLLTALKDER